MSAELIADNLFLQTRVLYHFFCANAIRLHKNLLLGFKSRNYFDVRV